MDLYVLRIKRQMVAIFLSLNFAEYVFTTILTPFNHFFTGVKLYALPIRAYSKP